VNECINEIFYDILPHRAEELTCGSG